VEFCNDSFLGQSDPRSRASCVAMLDELALDTRFPRGLAKPGRNRSFASNDIIVLHTNRKSPKPLQFEPNLKLEQPVLCLGYGNFQKERLTWDTVEPGLADDVDTSDLETSTIDSSDLDEKPELLLGQQIPDAKDVAKKM